MSVLDLYKESNGLLSGHATHPLVVSVKVLELPLLGLFLPGLVGLLRLATVELCVSVCKSLRVEPTLSLLLLVRPVVYQVK